MRNIIQEIETTFSEQLSAETVWGLAKGIWNQTGRSNMISCEEEIYRKMRRNRGKKSSNNFTIIIPII